MDLNKAYQLSFPNQNLPIKEGYRDYDGQVFWKDYWIKHNNPGNAAEPGTSNHGWGMALDLDIGQFDWTSSTYIWMKDNAERFSWKHPDWAEPNGAHPEAWHWEFQGAYTPEPQPTIRNDDMAALISANTTKYNGIWLAAPGYWHQFTGGEYKQFSDHGLRAGIPSITAVNDLDFELLKAVYTKQSAV